LREEKYLQNETKKKKKNYTFYINSVHPEHMRMDLLSFPPFQDAFLC